MDSFDQLHRYLFDQAHVRGELVQLQHSYQQMLQDHNYPLPIRRLLGELMAATSLLTATLKFEGEISLQLQSEGLVKYAVINGTHEQKLRGIARWDGELPQDSFSALFHKGVMVITITPDEGERYQGVVALEKDSLAECLEAYFEQSEQLPTKVILHTSEQSEALAAGMLLQVLPVEQQKSRDDFEHLSKLTETVKAEEMLGLKAEELLYRLYHQEEVELFEPQPVVFECSCSKERSSAALASVDKQELLDIVAREGKIAMNCQYCNTAYEFDAIDVEAIHAGQLNTPQQPQ